MKKDLLPSLLLSIFIFLIFSPIESTASNGPQQCEYTVISPNGHEFYFQGDEIQVTWSAVGNSCSNNVSIELQTNALPTVIQVITNSTDNNGSFDWNIPIDLAPDTRYTIKIIDNIKDSNNDSSDQNFTILKFSGCLYEILTPNGGETWIEGQNEIIEWTKSGKSCSDDVSLKLSKGGLSYITINNNTINDGYYEWTAELFLDFPGSDFKLEILDIADDGNFYFDSSDEFFTLEEANCIYEISSPSNGNIYKQGDAIEISWTSIGNDCDSSVAIELINNGQFNSTISPSTLNNSNYTWFIPYDSAFGNNLSIGVMSTDTPFYYNESEGIFTIIPDMIFSSSFELNDKLDFQ